MARALKVLKHKNDVSINSLEKYFHKKLGLVVLLPLANSGRKNIINCVKTAINRRISTGSNYL